MKAAIIGIAGASLSEAEAALIGEHAPAGVILFARNVVDPAQLCALTAALRRVLGPQAVLMVDQEGGRVARLRPPHWRAHPSAARLGAVFAADPSAGLRAAWLSGALIGAECAQAGFDVVAAPVLDLRWPGAHEGVVGDRAFAADPEAVAAMGGAFAAGLLAAGVQPVAKHIPGHGRARVDSHLALPRITEAETDLAADLLAFRRNAGLPWAMTAHILYEAWDRDRPASLSPVVIGEVIRGRIGFQGVLVSDDLAMRALTGPPAMLARSALAAGCDLTAFCTGEVAASAALLAECPQATDAAAARLARARAMAAAARRELDQDALADELAALLARFGAGPAGDTARAEVPGAKSPTGDDPTGNGPGGYEPRGNEPRGNEPRGNASGEEEPAGNEPRPSEPRPNEPGGDDSTGNEPQGNEPQVNQSQGNQSRGNQSRGNQCEGNEYQGKEPVRADQPPNGPGESPAVPDRPAGPGA